MFLYIYRKIPVYRAASNRVRRGELCSPAIGTGWFSSAGDHRSPLQCCLKQLGKSEFEALPADTGQNMMRNDLGKLRAKVSAGTARSINRNLKNAAPQRLRHESS